MSKCGDLLIVCGRPKQALYIPPPCLLNLTPTNLEWFCLFLWSLFAFKTRDQFQSSTWGTPEVVSQQCPSRVQVIFVFDHYLLGKFLYKTWIKFLNIDKKILFFFVKVTLYSPRCPRKGQLFLFFAKIILRWTFHWLSSFISAFGELVLVLMGEEG